MEFLDHLNFLPSILFHPSSYLQALQKIWLASHIRCIADLLHANAIQQLEVALLGTPAAQVIDLLTGALAPSSSVAAPAQPHPRTFMSSPPAPPLTSVPVMGVSTTSQGPAIASTSGGDELTIKYCL